MLQHKHVPDVEFAVINTDIKSLESVSVNHNIYSIQIGEKSTRGWEPAVTPMSLPRLLGSPPPPFEKSSRTPNWFS